MGPRMAHVAVPEDNGGIRLDHLKRVHAVCWVSHGNGVRERRQKSTTACMSEGAVGRGRDIYMYTAIHAKGTYQCGWELSTGWDEGGMIVKSERVEGVEGM